MNDPVYKEYKAYDEIEKNATPGQELLKQQYTLEFTFQGYATEFVDTVLVQLGELTFCYEKGK